MKTKQELLQEIESKINGGGYYGHYKYHLSLLYSAIVQLHDDDVDLKAVLCDGMEWNIIDLFLDCYDLEDLTKWLVDHDFDVFVDYRFSDRYYRDECDDDEWENLIDDCLFSNEKVCVKSW